MIDPWGRIIQSLCGDVHLQFPKLGGSTQKTIRKLCQVVVVEPPGEARNQTVVWDCALHSSHWYERSVHYTQYTGGLSMQGISCNANQKPDCNSVMPYGIIISISLWITHVHEV